jgi:predicted nuclease with TOPRIM domain
MTENERRIEIENTLGEVFRIENDIGRLEEKLDRLNDSLKRLRGETDDGRSEESV